LLELAPEALLAAALMAQERFEAFRIYHRI
jgi:hypothetical protein